MKPVYFYSVPAGPPERAEYQYLAVCLAEGLRSLGVPTVGDVDYWRATPDAPPLIAHDPDIRPEDCAAVVVSHVWPESGRPLPSIVGAPGGPVAVYLDQADGVVTASWSRPFRAFDLVLRTHANDRQQGVPANVRPWPFGLSERVLRATAGGPSMREWALLLNFRVRHLLRRRAGAVLRCDVAPVLPLDTRTDAFDAASTSAEDLHLWEATGRRHNPAYYARLRSARAGATFGGFLGLSALPTRPRALYQAARLAAHAAAPLGAKLGGRALPLYQWDSWRLWETLAAGTAAFHVDLRAHGAAFPVAPTANVHYVALDLHDPRPTIERIRDDPDWLARVGAAGQAWARAHYGPVPTARRFLDLVELAPPPWPSGEPS